MTIIMTTQTPATAENKTWLPLQVGFLKKFSLRLRIQVRN